MNLPSNVNSVLKNLVTVGQCACGQDIKLPAFAKTLPPPERCGGCEGIYRAAKEEADIQRIAEGINDEKVERIQAVKDTGKRLTTREIQDYVTALYKDRTGFPAGAEISAQYISVLGTYCDERVKKNFIYWIYQSTEKPTIKRFLETMGVKNYNGRAN